MAARFSTVLIISSQRKSNKKGDEILKYGCQLGISKAPFTIQDIATQTAQCSQIRQERRQDITALIGHGCEFALPVKEKNDPYRYKCIKHHENRQQHEMRLNRKDPECQRRQQCCNDSDVDADKDIALFFIQPLFLSARITGCHRQDHIDK